MLEKLGYGWIEPSTCIEKNDTLFEDNNYDEDKEFHQNEITEVNLYDLSLTHEENFEDGEITKYILLPIDRDGFLSENSFSPLINAGAKIVMNSEQFSKNSENLLDFMVLDYDTIFGLRLLTFQKYNSSFFSSDERVFFEALLIKFHSFKFKPFYVSYPTIHKELGIKKDRAITISRKFQKLGFLKSEIKTSRINDRPSQVTYYDIDTDVILELLPKIFKDRDLNDIRNDIKKYLEPALKRKKDSGADDIMRSTW